MLTVGAAMVIVGAWLGVAVCAIGMSTVDRDRLQVTLKRIMAVVLAVIWLGLGLAIASAAMEAWR